jgi:ligand-binding sensor domain-containing protein
MWFRLLICLSVGAFWPYILTAQEEASFVFQRLSVEQGLTSGEYNYYVYQDREGMVWISSIAGLNRFDGRQVRQYFPEPDDPHSLFDVIASQSPFFEDREGHLWFSNKNGIVRYDRYNDRFDRYQLKGPDGKKVASGYLWMHLDAESGELWANTVDHQFVCNISNPAEAVHMGPYEVLIKSRMYRAGDGGFYLFEIGTGKPGLGLRRFLNRRESAPPQFFESPGGVRINDALYLADTQVWTASAGGLRNLNLQNGQWSAPAQFNGAPLRDIVELELCADGRIIAATLEQGLYFYDPPSGRFTSQIKAFKDGRVSPFAPRVDRIYLDGRNNLWISTAGDGVFYTNLDKPKFRMALVNESERLGSVMDICQGRSGALWVLHSQSVLRIQGRDTVFYKLPITGRGTERPTFLREDRAGRVWAGTLKSLFLKTPEEHAFREIQPGVEITGPRPGYLGMVELSDGSAIIATNKQTVLRISPDITSATKVSDTPKHSDHIALTADRRLFIYGSGDSLLIWRLDEDKLKKETEMAAIPYVTKIAFDSLRNCHWIATLNGLYRLTKKTDGGWKLEREEQFPIRAVNSLSVCNAGKLWMGTAQGLVRYDPGNGARRLFGIEDGLPSLGFILGAVFKTPEGIIYFGTNNGLCIVDPEKAASRIAPAQAAILDIRINQEAGVAHRYSGDSLRSPAFIRRLTLPFSKNNLYFRFSALEYSAPQKCEFRYQLRGSTDESMVDLGASDELNFTNLSPGKYTLNIWAANSDGEWSAEPRALEILVSPPWYQTWPFYLAVVLALAGVFYGLYRYRLNEIKQREGLERAASELRRQAAETETAVLRLQMDPHFIFNSLNSIDAFLLKGDKATAHDYLIRFADLMRNILNNSEQAMTNLEQEIELLEKYLSTEQMRIGPRMQFSFEVAPDVDPFEEQIPTMILQPFVENAIWHGISPKNGPGRIAIRFRIEANELICEVADDGVGRGQEPSTKKHASKATLITDRRFDLLAKSASGQPPRYTIIDEKDQLGQAAGTTVRFHFPR